MTERSEFQSHRWMAQKGNRRRYLEVLEESRGNRSLAVKHKDIGVNTDTSVSNEWVLFGDIEFQAEVEAIMEKHRNKFKDTEWEQEFNKSTKRLIDFKLESMLKRAEAGEEVDEKELATIQCTGDGHLATKARINKLRAETEAIKAGKSIDGAANKLEITVKPVQVTPEQASEVAPQSATSEKESKQ